MRLLNTPSLSVPQKEEIFILWNNEYPTQMILRDMRAFDAYLDGLGRPSHCLIVSEEGYVKGWYCNFIRNEGLWFVMIIDGSIQGRGYGKKLIARAMTEVDELNGWVIDHDNYVRVDGTAYRSPLTFYKKCGFGISDVRLETDRISAVKIIWKRKEDL